jgi:hypothetical protein
MPVAGRAQALIQTRAGKRPPSSSGRTRGIDCRPGFPRVFFIERQEVGYRRSRMAPGASTRPTRLQALLLLLSVVGLRHP